MTGHAFAFADDPAMRRWARAFLIHPETCMVLVSEEQLTITFGRWALSTAPSNVADVSITGPYRWWKVAGPARLSLADRGITFATTARRGVCLSFHEPVPAFDPIGVVRHPAATVTVADPEGFASAVRAAMEAAATGAPPADEDATAPGRPPGNESAGPRQGTYRESAAALRRWRQRGADTVRHERRDVDVVLPPESMRGAAERIQRFDEGVGAAFHRRYAVVVDRADADARGAMARVQADFNAICNQRLAPVTKVAGRFGLMCPGDRYALALAGPWSGPVEVVEVTPESFLLTTLHGHLEAGLIEFRMSDREDGALAFTIESWARSGGHALRVLYDVFGLAQQLQSEMWVEVCEAIPGFVHGVQRGPVDVLTERAVG